MIIEFNDKDCNNCLFNTRYRPFRKGPCDRCFFKGHFEPSTKFLLEIIIKLNDEVNILKDQYE